MNSYRDYAAGAFGQVHFRVAEAAQPRHLPLVLCHQSPSSLRQFDAVYPLLAAAGVTAIGVDYPGFGNSDVPDRVPTIEDFADSTVHVLDKLRVTRAHILGQHTGSMVAMEATLRHPRRFERLILNAPTPFSAQERAQWLETLVARQRSWVLREDGQHLQQMWDRRTRITPGWSNLPAMHRHVLQMLIAGDTLWYGHNASLIYDQEARLPLIRHDCLVLNNTGDALYGLCCKALELRPDFAHVVLEGGTHDIVDEQPQAWTDAVVNFLPVLERG